MLKRCWYIDFGPDSLLVFPEGKWSISGPRKDKTSDNLATQTLLLLISYNRSIKNEYIIY